ncbi:MAG: proline dehydrogenase family protein, partial [Phormidesmis sp. CAN_BIN44]|nr:proline dehydrogenase family protein [Phormidesmis sp. CAN_BIN44]
LGWTMENPGLRVQLFRFIDCLPSLRSKAEIARHMQEYLSDASVELPDALKGLLNFANADSVPGQVAATTVSTAVETLAHKYISGETPKQVLKTLERLRKGKMGFTVDLLGEAVITETEAQSYLDRYLDLMTQLTEAAKNWATVPAIDLADGQPLSKVQVSVKLTAFYSQFDPLDARGSQTRVSDRIRVLLRRAKELGAAVHFDMEQYAYKDLTLAILKQILLEDEFRDRSNIGMTLQAYLRDSEGDLQDLITWAKQRGTPLTIRLVKGAYWDQETIKAAQKDWEQPVYNEKSATDANFETLTQLLLENHDYLYAAIGSHNVRTQAHAIAIAKALNIPARRIEFQTLYGMGDKLAKAIVDQGYRVRVYCPYGDLIPGMSYLIRRLLENTANSSFLRQNLEERPIEELLAAPKISEAKPSNLNAHNFVNVADTDYADRGARDHLQQTLQTVRQQLGKTYLPFIDGQFVETSEKLASVNPSQFTEVVGQIGMISVEQADHAIAAAKAAFPAWQKTPAIQRANILRKAGDLLVERRDDLIAWMVLETGKPVREADGEVSEAIDFCRYYADEMERLEVGDRYDLPGETNRYRYHAKGIVLVISPWNFPLAIPLGMTVAAIVTGNCALLKPAETSSVIAAKIAEILIDAGVPRGVFQFVP